MKLVIAVPFAVALIALVACTPAGTTATPATRTSTAGASPTVAATRTPTHPPPTRTPTPTPVPPTATPIPVETLTADLATQVATALPPPESRRGIEGLSVFPLDTGDAQPMLWAVHTYGGTNVEEGQMHFVAIYTRAGEAWQELSRVALDMPGWLSDNSVTQVPVEPTEVWLQAGYMVGAHGGCFEVLRFDGRVLHRAVSHCNAMPGAGNSRMEDVNGDARLDVVLDQTDAYVFCYACGVRLPMWSVLAWDGTRLLDVRLEPLPDSAPADLRDLINRAVTLANGELWKDAQALAEQARALRPQDPVALWDIALIELTAQSRDGGITPVPMLNAVFYGDYAAAVEILRPYTPAELFGPPPLVLDYTEGFEEEVSDYVVRFATAALGAQPDLAEAYFVRAWATQLVDPVNPSVLADAQRAAELEPGDTLFVESAAYLAAQP